MKPVVIIAIVAVAMIGFMVPSGFSYSPCDDPSISDHPACDSPYPCDDPRLSDHPACDPCNYPSESDYHACDPCTDPSMSDHPVCSKEKSKNIDISNYCKFGESMFQCTFLPLQNFSNAELDGADLSNAELDGADLSGANLSNADLSGANLSNADIRHLDFTHAKIDGANFDHSIIYDEINSSVGYWENPIPAMATIDCSKDTDSISQTPLETTTSKLQKKLNEYWYCAIGATMYANYKDCVKYDEKHTIGIPPTEITQYQIEKDDTLTFVYEDSDISPKLETFRDQSLHQDLWEIYTSITPPEILSEVVSFVVYTDDYAETSESAAVNRASLNPLKFLVSVDPVDMVPSGIKIDKQFYISTMIHENAHILSLSASQGDNKSISVDTANSPDMYKQEMKNGERSCAPNYYNDFAGCMNQNSYLNAFFQEFWSEIYDDFKWSLEFDDYETFNEHHTEFYFKYEKYWLTEYSSENPNEDFAESFMAFVLREKPSAPTFAEQKILFFYQYPELVEMRDFIRSAIATTEFCDDGICPG